MYSYESPIQEQQRATGVARRVMVAVIVAVLWLLYPGPLGRLTLAAVAALDALVFDGDPAVLSERVPGIVPMPLLVAAGLAEMLEL